LDAIIGFVAEASELLSSPEAVIRQNLLWTGIVDTLMTPKGEHPPAPANPIMPEDARLEHIEHLYHEAVKYVSQTARMLQMHRRTLQRILRRNRVLSNAAH
jgi:ActR/RegA family two-component response regulator